MAGPVNRNALCKRRLSGRRAGQIEQTLEEQLDALLASPQSERDAIGAGEQQAATPSPIEQLRTLFVEQIIPAIYRLNERYSEKGVNVKMDALDFLNGGCSLFVDVEFSEHHMRLEGTVLADKIAFYETRRMNDMGGTVAAGPTIRTRNLNEKVFCDFVYERIIALVKDASP